MFLDNTRVPAPGSRLEIRGEEWVLRHADRAIDGDLIISVTGLSSLVRDQDWQFIVGRDDYVVIDPKKTTFVHDTSSQYAAARLHTESLLRSTPPVDARLHLGHRGAMDVNPYQMVPAVFALTQPRPRILIADGTGLGKTVEAGILIAELMRRGRGRRILVVTLKSMLTQFQKELWTRFAIPLVRLDTVGIERVRSQIPFGHNPLNYFDKSIISIDTLKSARQYKNFVEQAYWDIVVIDEAQNVAHRGTRSLRNKLADLLASRSDALIMLSATPHDGSARSFASLVEMLDPTAIANPDDYTREDLKNRNLFVRRFKKDIRHEVTGSFQERRTSLARCTATGAEDRVYAAIADTSNQDLDARTGAGWLLRTVLEKSALSSPAACLETVQHRLETLRKAAADGKPCSGIRPMEQIAALLEDFPAAQFSKYQLLKRILVKWQWDGSDPHDRIVVFTERIRTLEFLQEHLQKDLQLPEGAIRDLRGTQADVNQQEVVTVFGNDQNPVRLLLSTDVGAEGINLHYHCCRLIHFDIPWSLMVLQQRNGRIDRYGQERCPEIVYLVTDTANSKFRDDQRILDILVRKEEQAHNNIGDPASLMKVFEVPKEENKVKEAVEAGMDPEAAEHHFFVKEPEGSGPMDFLDILIGRKDLAVTSVTPKTHTPPSLYASDYYFLKSALEYIRSRGRVNFELRTFDDDERLQVTIPDAMRGVVDFLPIDVRPPADTRVLDLSANRIEVMAAIRRSRSTKKTWPALHYLWPLHPLVNWATDNVRTCFLRMHAPVVALSRLPAGTLHYVISASYPNRRGRSVLQKWCVITRTHGGWPPPVHFESSPVFRDLQDPRLPNEGCDESVIGLVQRHLSKAVDRADTFVASDRKAFVKRVDPRMKRHLDDLEQLKAKHEAHVGAKYALDFQLTRGRRERALKRISEKFENYRGWITDTMRLGDDPYIHVVLVVAGIGQA